MIALALPEKALASAVQALPDNSLAANRKAALASFLDRGFPTTRLEDWKYTDLTTVAEISQRWLENGAPAPSAAAIDARIEEIRSAIDADWLVIGNGAIRNPEALSSADGVSVARFSDLAHEPGFEHPLADLNAALLSDGLHVRVAADTAHERPIGIMIVDGADTEAGVAQAPSDIDEQGMYSFADLPAGDYAMGIESPEGLMSPVDAPPVLVRDRELSRRDLKLMSAEEGEAGQTAHGNYGLGHWWAGLTPAAKAWTIVAIVVVAGVTVALLADDTPQASDFQPATAP